MQFERLTQDVNEKLFQKNGKKLSLTEFLETTVSAEKRSDEKPLMTEKKAGVALEIPRTVHFNGITFSQAQFRMLVDIKIEALSPVGFRNLLGALSIYAPSIFKDKAVFAKTEDFARSEIGRNALAYQETLEKKVSKDD